MWAGRTRQAISITSICIPSLLGLYYLLQRSIARINREILLLGALLALWVPLTQGLVTGNWMWYALARGQIDIFIIDLLWLIIALLAFIAYRKSRAAPLFDQPTKTSGLVFPSPHETEELDNKSHRAHSQLKYLIYSIVKATNSERCVLFAPPVSIFNRKYLVSPGLLSSVVCRPAVVGSCVPWACKTNQFSPSKLPSRLKVRKPVVLPSFLGASWILFTR